MPGMMLSTVVLVDPFVGVGIVLAALIAFVILVLVLIRVGGPVKLSIGPLHFERPVSTDPTDCPEPMSKDEDERSGRASRHGTAIVGPAHSLAQRMARERFTDDCFGVSVERWSNQCFVDK